MPPYILLFILIFLSIPLKAQFNAEKYDKQSFLVGTLNEYTGYQRTFTPRDNFYYRRVDIMNKNDIKKALFLDSLFSSDYSDIYFVNNGAPMDLKMYSPSLSKKIDEYYKYTPGKTFTLQHDTIFIGNLEKEKFVTKKQKISFLLGTYLHCGRDEQEMNSTIFYLNKEELQEDQKKPNDGYFGFIMPNSPSKAKICAALLKDLDCEGVEYILRTNTIPIGHFVLFKPSVEIQKMIQDANHLKKYIQHLNTDHIEFTRNSTKFISNEPER